MFSQPFISESLHVHAHDEEQITCIAQATQPSIELALSPWCIMAALLSML
jgi:hypothetical protein